MVLLVFKPWEVIKVHVSMYMNMLDIIIESYEHMQVPLGFISCFEKNHFSRKLRIFFNSLIGKNINVIKVWLLAGFFHGAAHFLTQSTCHTLKPTFPKF